MRLYMGFKMDEKELIKYEFSLFSSYNQAKIKKKFGFKGKSDENFLEEFPKSHSLLELRERCLKNKIGYSNRIDFKAPERTAVSERANLLCSNCCEVTQHPLESDSMKSANLGIIAHIYPAKNTGPRGHEWNKLGKDPEYLRTVQNAIFLCVRCSVLIDTNDGAEFKADDLIKMKQDHEQRIRDKDFSIMSVLDIRKEYYNKLLQEDEANIIVELELLIEDKFSSVSDLSNQSAPSLVIQERNVIGLSIPNQKLENIPRNILKFNNLKIISFKNNHLRHFNILGKIITLEQIHLNDNMIGNIPDEISNLKELVVLDLRGNRISKLNPSLFTLNQLKKLDIRQNQIEILPEDINHLTSLKKLLIKDNKLKDMPSLNLQSIEELDLRNNHFSHERIEQAIKEKYESARIGRSFDEIHQIFSQIPEEHRKFLDEVEFDSDKMNEFDLPEIYTLNDLSHFLKILNTELAKLLTKRSNVYYNRANIPKGNNAFRTLDIPNTDILKKVQYMILRYILQQIPVSDHAYCYGKGRSQIQNAQNHLNSEIIIKLDFKNFFYSIKFPQVLNLFRSFGYSGRISVYLTTLLLYYDQNENEPYLPQGPKSSPYLSSLVCKEMDDALVEISNKFNFTYTRYSDDITFSTKVKKIPSGFFHAIFKEINKYGFTINKRKLKIQNRCNRQMVTGILVNHHDPRVPRSYLNTLRREIFELEHKITDEMELIEQYIKLKGKCDQLNHINPERYEKYLKKILKIQNKRNIYPD